MLTDGPVTVSVLVTVIHFVAVREMSEVRNDIFYHITFYSELVQFQKKYVLLDQQRSCTRLLWGHQRYFGLHDILRVHLPSFES